MPHQLAGLQNCGLNYLRRTRKTNWHIAVHAFTCHANLLRLYASQRCQRKIAWCQLVLAGTSTRARMCIYKGNVANRCKRASEIKASIATNAVMQM